MRAAADHLPELARSLRIRVVYTDLDGTLLGPGGSLFADAERRPTTRAAQAVAALHRGGIELVPVSGRTREQVFEVARMLGCDSFIAELGGITARDGEVTRARGAYRGPGTPVEAMRRGGAAALLMEAFRGRIEPHAPWAWAPRECTLLLRGHVEVAEARSLLERAGYGWLDLVDNGVIARRFPGLEVEEVHAYHLLPSGVDKAAAVSIDVAARGLEADGCIAVGDSPSDAALAPWVSAVFVVANGARAVEDAADNVFVTDGAFGDGFAEVVEGLVPGPGAA